MDRSKEHSEALREATTDVPALSIEFSEKGKNKEGIAFGVYNIQVIAPLFACVGCGKKEAGQPVGLDRRTDKEDPWAGKPRYTLDFAPPLNWGTGSHASSDDSTNLCAECEKDFNRSRDVVWTKFFDVWLVQRRKEQLESRDED